METSDHANDMTRRRAIRIIGAGAGITLAGLSLGARAGGDWRRWEGGVMGASASIDLHARDGRAGARLIALCLTELRRLEAVFSLHRSQSALNRLNAAGKLAHAPRELIDLIGHCRAINSATAGAFDVTVQPLWRLYADHFAAGNAPRSGPPAVEIGRALALVDLDAVRAEGRSVWFARPGMALTFNGIAQGYIADRIAAVLRRRGIDRVLVDMGEIVARGRDRDNRPWRVGLLDPRRELEIAHTVALSDQALATSGGYGLRFDTGGRFHHLLDPRTGLSPQYHLAVSVTAPDATLADGLSTAFSAMPERDIAAVLARFPDAGALITRRDGTVRRLGAFAASV